MKTSMRGRSFLNSFFLMENTRYIRTMPRKKPHRVYLIQNAMAVAAPINTVSFLSGRVLLLSALRRI